MSSEELSYEEQLARLQQEYLAELPERIREVERAWQAYRGSNHDADRLKALHYPIHRIAGSASTFGLSNISDLARVAELSLKPLMRSDTQPTEIQLDELRNQISTLLGAAPSHEQKVALNTPAHPFDIPATDRPLIYLLEDDRPFAENLALQLGSYDYRVEHFADTPAIERAFKEQHPSLLIADIMLDPADLSGPAFIERLRRTVNLNIPIIIYSARGDFEARLSAVRADADAYFVKPIETDLLVEKIDTLLRRKPKQPYQVLLIDDDIALAKHYALVLTQAEIKVRVVTQPGSVLMALDDFHPDLIIMDLYMPKCSGFELAKVIRHQSQFDSIPIIFLSTEDSFDKQLIAMRMGGDEFITKPIQDQHLLTAVLIRAERSRLLNNLIMNDSLTGLLKHARMKEQLAKEVAHSSRTNAQFAFVMIDIDLFKRVNDSYGHLVGDKVISSLAQLLRKRLRSNDIVARFGGEEFAAILQDCSAQDALKLIDAIRDTFQQLIHRSGEQEFHTSFSAGIALFPDYAAAEELNRAADEALYQAKSAGRNRVVLNRPSDQEE